MNRPCILKSKKFIDMVTKLPEIHAKGFENLEKFCDTNGSFCPSPDLPRVTFTIKLLPPPGCSLNIKAIITSIEKRFHLLTFYSISFCNLPGFNRHSFPLTWGISVESTFQNHARTSENEEQNFLGSPS